MKSISIPAFVKSYGERRWRRLVQSGVLVICLVAMFFAHELGHTTAVLVFGEITCLILALLVRSMRRAPVP